MSTENGLSMLDPNQITQNVHNEAEKALDVITANSLVPKRYGKIELEYILSGNGTGEIGTAKYFSDGAYQSQTITTRGDILGSAHKTVLNFYNRTPNNLANRFFTIYEAAGAVTVWFNLGGTGVPPVTENRIIPIIISTIDTEQQLAKKLDTAINLDSSFFSVNNDVMVMIVNRAVGVRTDSKDINTGLVVKNISGEEENLIGGRYFLLNNALNTAQYYVWFNVNNSSINPLVTGKTGLEVAVFTGASAEDIANSISNTLLSTNDYLTNIDSDKITITNAVIGATIPIQDINCQFGIKTNTLGSSRVLIARLVMTYDVNGNITSVERL